MSNQSEKLNHRWVKIENRTQVELQQQPSSPKEPTFYYFAYGSCMCPVDLKRSLGENTYSYVIGPGILKAYRLGFYVYSHHRQCGVLDVVNDTKSLVKGVLYQLPWRLSQQLDQREGVSQGLYRQEIVDIQCQNQIYNNVRTYVVVNKLEEEIAPNDWYFNVVLRGAITCGLPEEYCWHLFNKMHQLQQFNQNQARHLA